jgi:hypothetical protein
MHVLRMQVLDMRGNLHQTWQDLLNTKIAQGVAAFKKTDVQ